MDCLPNLWHLLLCQEDESDDDHDMDGDEDGDGAPSPADDKPVKKVADHLLVCSS